MADSHDEPTRERDDKQTSSSGILNRRRYLQLAASAAVLGGSAAATGTGAAATERHGITFDRTVNVVEDYGADPTGNEPSDDAFDDAAGNGTLVIVPEGTYQFSSGFGFGSLERVGFLGEGEARLVAPDGFNDWLINSSSDQTLLENLTIDMTASKTAAGIRCVTPNSFHIQDITYDGRGYIGDTSVTNGMNVGVRNSGGTGVIKNYTAKKGSVPGNYNGGNGRVGIWAGSGHEGTLKVIDPHLEEFGNNAMYCSRCPGNVQVTGGFFRNNNVSAVRISGQGSWVEGASIVVDPSTYDGPGSLDDNVNGVVIEQSPKEIGFWKDPGAEVRDCDIHIKPNATNGRGINMWSNGKTLTVRNTRIRIDNDAPAVTRETDDRYQGKNPPSDPPRWIRMENVQITGEADGGPTLQIDDAPNSEIRNCCISQSGSNRNGVVFTNSDGSVVEDTAIDVSGTAVDVNGSNVSTSNVTSDASCTDVNISGSSSDGSTSDGSTSDGSTSDGSTSDSTSLPNTITIDGGEANYAFTVSKELQAESGIGSGDSISGSSAEGFVNGGSDTYAYSGEVTDFTLDGSATVLVNGSEVDPSTLGSSTSDGSTSDGSTDDSTSDDATSLPNTLTIDGGQADYAFTVSKELQEGSGIGTQDSISGSSAEGFVNGGSDTYAYSGEVTDFTLSGEAEVLVDGQTVDPSTLGVTEHTLSIEGQGSETPYSLTVSGSLSAESGVGSGDSVSGSSADGFVRGGTDTYAYTGEVTEFSLDGSATVLVDGTEVDPATLGSNPAADLPNRIVLDGSVSDGTTTYQLSVGGDLVKDASESVELDDSVDSGTASGSVAEDRDAFGFSGAITDLDVDGAVSVEFDRS